MKLGELFQRLTSPIQNNATKLNVTNLYPPLKYPKENRIDNKFLKNLFFTFPLFLPPLIYFNLIFLLFFFFSPSFYSPSFYFFHHFFPPPSLKHFILICHSLHYFFSGHLICHLVLMSWFLIDNKWEWRRFCYIEFLWSTRNRKFISFFSFLYPSVFFTFLAFSLYFRRFSHIWSVYSPENIFFNRRVKNTGWPLFLKIQFFFFFYLSMEIKWISIWEELLSRYFQRGLHPSDLKFHPTTLFWSISVSIIIKATSLCSPFLY